MVREKNIPTKAFEVMIKRDISPLFKAVGYRKKGFHYRHKQEAVLKVIGFISSRFGSTSVEKNFDIYIGVQFEEVCQHFGMEMPDKPLNYIECLGLGINTSISAFYPPDEASPQGFLLRNESDAARFGPQFAARFEDIISNLSQFDDLASFRQHEYFHSPALREPERAVIYYLLGENENCHREIDRLMKVLEAPGVDVDRDWHLQRLKISL